MTEDKVSSRSIDLIRDSALSMKVGGPDDGKITQMVSLSDQLLVVMERAIYVTQLADSIDPGRTNISIPNTQQKLLSRGSDDPIVAKTLLTAQVLFKKAHLGDDFDEDRGLALALDLMKDIVTMADMLSALEATQKAAIEALKESAQERSLTLPAIGDAEARCDAFAQKVGHAVDILRDIARLFYGEALTKRWIDSLAELTKERYGSEDSFTQYVGAVRPFLLLLREMRNMVEHPKPDSRIKTFDFRLLPSGQIMFPSVEIVRSGEEISQISMASLMQQVTDDITHVAEVLMAYLCNAHVKPFPPFAIQVLELPEVQRSHPLVRMAYGCIHGEQIMHFG